jgi:pimeloyl-ACP methyl ester carboxylesterase
MISRDAIDSEMTTTPREMITTSRLEPFKLYVEQPILDDLAERLKRARLPPEPFNAGWNYGTQLTFMQRVLTYWRDEYDWRSVERRLNRFQHYIAPVDGYRVHLIVERGSGRNPLPLVMTHGWPGSFVEFDAIIEQLAHPERFGGNAEDGFDVIVPSIPGYGWSSAPAAPITTREMARLWNLLMTENLGYSSYVAQGGDWGSLIASWLGVDYPDYVQAVHVNMMGLRPYTGPGSKSLTEQESSWLKSARDRLRQENGYQFIQGTKPQTLAYALNDSPIGLAAWIIEKFHGWSTPNAESPPFSLEQLITNVMVYWVTGSANSASWLYTAARRSGGMGLDKDEYVGVPTGFLSAPNDLFPPPPDDWVRRTYNCVHRTNLHAGGHFIAFERGDEFVADVQMFFRQFRSR